MLIVFGLFSCKPKEEVRTDLLDVVAEKYVKLALHIGHYDPDFIDAYYGPEEWVPEHLETEFDDDISHHFEELKWELSEIFTTLEEIPVDKLDSLQRLRYNFISKQVHASKTRLQFIMGKSLPFDVEALSLYDAVPPKYDKVHFDSLLNELDQILPGNGDLTDRYNEYVNTFTIPEDKLDIVFNTALEEAKSRTSKYIDLPEGESFSIEYVTDKTWSGYNWYQGEYQSLIQLNTDFPINISRAVDLACHEGYPGHHVYNMMLEKVLVEEKGWIEFAVYPLFTPQSLIAEGSANYGIDMVFPEVERVNYEKNILFPLAGLDTAKASEYAKIRDIKVKLNYANNEVARRYLNYTMSEEEAIDWLIKYALYSEERAAQRLSFIEKYRSYVINYNLGRDIIENFVNSKAGLSEEVERWKVFEEILTTPLTASILSN